MSKRGELPLAQRLESYMQSCSGLKAPLQVKGHLTRKVGLTLEAVGCVAAVGSYCYVKTLDGDEVTAEVVGFNQDRTFLMPINDTRGLAPGSEIIFTGEVAKVPVGEELLGRVIDGCGAPLDGLGPMLCNAYVPLHGNPINPLERAVVRQPFDVGIRSVNSLLPLGRGQRVGLFAGSGVGKSMLLGMMTRFSEADVVVVGLVGERGREVREFIETSLGKEGMKRSVVVAAPADTSPLMRMNAAQWATSVAEYFRDQGANVLLLMDSLTRFSQAQRELALAVGEPPATKGYPPSVFAALPHLVERAGNASEQSGSITAIYTVLVEGDDIQDPIADSARAILDGHIMLSRSLADRGQYPAIDIEGSVSRAATAVVGDEQLELMRLFKQIYSKYQQNRDLITVGAYARGSDPELDVAIELMPKMLDFLRQGINQRCDIASSLLELQAMINADSLQQALVAHQ